MKKYEITKTIRFKARPQNRNAEKTKLNKEGDIKKFNLYLINFYYEKFI